MTIEKVAPKGLYRLKYLTVWLSCFGLLFVPFKAPNLEPITASILPLSKKSSYLMSALFGSSCIFIFDVFTSGIGMWSWVRAIMFALMGIAAHAYYQNRKSTRWNLLGFSVGATLIYDLVTGVFFGPVFFGMSLTQAFIGQIPFSILHLLGNGLLAVAVSPLLAAWLEAAPQTVVQKKPSVVVS